MQPPNVSGSVDELTLQQFFADALPEVMPTIIALNDRKEHNIFGSKTVNATDLGDTLRFAYEDGSTVEVNNSNNWLYFCTKEGHKIPEQRVTEITTFLCGKEPDSGSYKLVGRGNYSEVYRLGVPYLATKVTTHLDIQRREMQLAGWKKYQPERSDQRGRIEAIDTSLVTSWKSVDKLRKNGVRVPSHYAFAISLKPRYIGSVEMMEYVPGLTLQAHMGFDRHGGFSRPDDYPATVVKALPHFSSSKDLMHRLYEDCYTLKEQAEAVEPNIGDIRPENLIVSDFNPETKRFEVALVDPIKVFYKKD